MFEGKGAWLLNGGISRRIALTMIASLLAIQAQAFLQLKLFSTPALHLIGTRQFESAAVYVYNELFAAPISARAQLLKALERRFSLKLEFDRERPREVSLLDSSQASHLAQDFRARLGIAPGGLIVSQLERPAPFPVPNLQAEISPTPSPGEPSAPGNTEPDTLVSPNLRIAAQGPDGTWLSISPVVFDERSYLQGPYVPLLVGGIIIALFSVGTARSIVKPLDRLVLAAARIGRSREFVPVSSEGLHEFSAVARAFEDMQERLLRFIDDRTQMLGAISHDLRSCLTRLRVTAESRGDATAQKILIREIDEMSAMLESTLAFARGEAHRSPSQSVDVAALLISLVDDAIDAGVDAYYSGPNHAEIRAVPISLKRAFRNLIDNAVKYGGVARVSLDMDEAMVRIVISDDGPGIAPERIDEALMPFRRLDNARSGTIPGAGLGLTIARDVILSHGGGVSLRNVLPTGLRVEVNLPSICGDRREQY